ncbi:hypothetical protein [Streptomyces sp. KL116D]|uniref:hypothetical protein n=1 Tax=Streptomyces sp. KL116D TaxID=3045152 RepID=UPI003557DA4D
MLDVSRAIDGDLLTCGESPSAGWRIRAPRPDCRTCGAGSEADAAAVLGGVTLASLLPAADAVPAAKGAA